MLQVLPLQLPKYVKKTSSLGTKTNVGSYWYQCTGRVRPHTICKDDTPLTDNGFKVTRAPTCNMFHAERQVYLIVHCDDFVSVADGEDLAWLKRIFETRLEISTVVLGQEGDAKGAKILNRIITAIEEGYLCDADSRHSELIVKHLGLQEADGTTSPTHNESDELLDHNKFKMFRSLCARANFLATDRHDLQFSTKELQRAMCKPTHRGRAKLKLLGRY